MSSPNLAKALITSKCTCTRKCCSCFPPSIDPIRIFLALLYVFRPVIPFSLCRNACVLVLAANPAAIVGVPTPGLQFMPVLNFCAAIWANNSRGVGGRTGPIRYVKHIWRVNGRGEDFECKRDWVDEAHCLLCFSALPQAKECLLYPNFKSLY